MFGLKNDTITQLDPTKAAPVELTDDIGADAATAPAAAAPPPPLAAAVNALPQNLIAELARELIRQGAVPMAGATAAPMKSVRFDPSPNLGRRCVVWLHGSSEPELALCTGDFYDDKHKGYVDVFVLPRTGHPYSRVSIPPADYQWVEAGA